MVDNTELRRIIEDIKAVNYEVPPEGGEDSTPDNPGGGYCWVRHGLTRKSADKLAKVAIPPDEETRSIARRIRAQLAQLEGEPGTAFLQFFRTGDSNPASTIKVETGDGETGIGIAHDVGASAAMASALERVSVKLMDTNVQLASQLAEVALGQRDIAAEYGRLTAQVEESAEVARYQAQAQMMGDMAPHLGPALVALAAAMASNSKKVDPGQLDGDDPGERPSKDDPTARLAWNLDVIEGLTADSLECASGDLGSVPWERIKGLHAQLSALVSMAP